MIKSSIPSHQLPNSLSRMKKWTCKYELENNCVIKRCSTRNSPERYLIIWIYLFWLIFYAYCSTEFLLSNILTIYFWGFGYSTGHNSVNNLIGMKYWIQIFEQNKKRKGNVHVMTHFPKVLTGNTFTAKHIHFM